MSQRRIDDCPSLLKFSMLLRVAASCNIVVVVADSVLLHEPAQLDEQSMRVGVLMFRAVELCQALGGLLAAQAYATQEFLYSDRTSSPSVSSPSSTKPWIVTALKHKTSVTRKHRRWTLAQAPLHVPSSFSSPLVQHVEAPVAGDGVDVDTSALRNAAVGLVFSECSGWVEEC